MTEGRNSVRLLRVELALEENGAGRWIVNVSVSRAFLAAVVAALAAAGVVIIAP